MHSPCHNQNCKEYELIFVGDHSDGKPFQRLSRHTSNKIEILQPLWPMRLVQLTSVSLSNLLLCYSTPPLFHLTPSLLTVSRFHILFPASLLVLPVPGLSFHQLSVWLVHPSGGFEPLNIPPQSRLSDHLHCYSLPYCPFAFLVTFITRGLSFCLLLVPLIVICLPL